jgi:hypothetical protein
VWYVVLVTSSNDEPITESCHGPARCAATAGHPEVSLTDKAPSRAANYFRDLPVTQCFTTLGYLTVREGEVLLFENLDTKLEHLGHEYAY